MLFGISTFVWHSPFSTSDFGLLYKIKNLGYDIIEVPVEEASLIDWERLKYITSDIGLKITISGAFGPGRDISSEDAHIRKEGIAYINECIKIAAAVGSPVFCGPLYSAVGKTRPLSQSERDREKDRAVSGLQSIAEVAGDYGIIAGVEPLNRFETDMINTIDQAISLVGQIDHSNIKIALDTFHANIEEKDIAAAIRKLGTELLCHIQANECDRGIAGSGHIDWNNIQQALCDIDYNGAIVLETFGAPSKELARAASIWRPLANNADELAKESIVFYKQLFKEKNKTII